MRTVRLLAVCGGWLWCCLLYGQKTRITAVENNLTENRSLIFEDSIIPRYTIMERMRHYNVPSVSIAVINDGKIEWAKTYGYADIERNIKPDTNTLYQVASISKSVNSAGIMQLVGSGKLSLSRDIRSYLKTWTFPDNEFSHDKTISLKHLLSHTAGLSVHGFIGYRPGDSIPTLNQILNGERPANNETVKPIYPPGKQFAYSGGGTVITRKILDDNISSNYDSLMQALILRPLRMTHSTFSQPLTASYTNFAHAYNLSMKPVNENFYIYPEQAAGGLWSTATDIARFVIAIQMGLKNNPASPFDQQSMREMLTPVKNDYSLGFNIMEKGGEKYFWHEGESYGYNSIYYGSFSTGKGVVILTNAYPGNGLPFIKELLNSVAATYEWKEFYNPVKRKLVSVPDSLLDRYTGEYVNENSSIKILITRKDHSLELTARQTEKMYAVASDTFFIASSPTGHCVFSSSGKDGWIDSFEVIQNDKTIIRAKKRK